MSNITGLHLQAAAGKEARVEAESLLGELKGAQSDLSSTQQRLERELAAGKHTLLDVPEAPPSLVVGDAKAALGLGEKQRWLSKAYLQPMVLLPKPFPTQASLLRCISPQVRSRLPFGDSFGKVGFGSFSR